jgi:quinohemoprotein ethanol dehydrogenase
MERIAVRREYARSSLATVVPRLAAAKFAVGRVPAALLATVAALAFCSTAAAQDAKGSAAHIKAVTTAIDGDAIKANTGTSKDWPMVGLDYGETRFSKLNQINTDNVKNLGLAWSYNLDSSRGVEATPIVVDGIMYVTAPWSVVHAVDARTGKKIWTFDPEVSREKGFRGCCDVVNRGVALHKGKVFVGAYDGRLIALDAVTGKKVWEKDTVIDHNHSYTITGAPRVANGRVIIGNGGAEYGVRGYVTAYDAETGNQAWRWFVVPGDPAKPYEDESMAAAAKTWDPAGNYWVNGGGGTVWDSITFDPDLNMVYIGTGNGSPWNRNVRSPAGGDNLYLASIVALNADSGKYQWHYQETPGDNWDYTSTQPMILADIAIDGAPRKVILHAPKNGFFFVIDRTNGKFISAKNFVDVNWATGYDANGRPIEVPDARSPDKSFDSIPGPYGAHNWHPMSFNPGTGLVYLPAQNVPLNLTGQPKWKHNANQPGEFAGGLGWNLGFALNATPPKSLPFGRLIAWDPVKQKEAWRQEHVSPWNGGTLTTAGNLVFQGTADGRFIAYNATTGEKLWESPTGTGVVAAPSTYLIDGVQYVSVAVGWGGVFGQAARATELNSPGTVYTFAVGSKAPLPSFTKYQMEGLLSGVKYDPADVGPGTLLYVSHCVVCHGVPGVQKGGNIRNLAYVGADRITHLKDIVFSGALNSQGMPDFTGKLKDDDVVKIIAFIQGVADSIRPK